VGGEESRRPRCTMKPWAPGRYDANRVINLEWGRPRGGGPTNWPSANHHVSRSTWGDMTKVREPRRGDGHK